jgi:hypothetical protein
MRRPPFPHRKILGTHFCYRLSRLKAIVRLEGIGTLKNPMTSSGIEPVTFRLLAYCLNQLRYHVAPADQGLRFIQRAQHYGSWIYFPLQQIGSHARRFISSIGTATVHRLDGRGIGVRLLKGPRGFSPLYRVQTGSGANRVSCPKDTWASFLEVKWTGSEPDHSLQSNVKINNTRIYISTPHTSSWCGA